MRMTDPRFYYLKDKKVIGTNDVLEWSKMFETNERYVANEHIGNLWVSTVFIGLDHSFGDGPPLIFETMVFDQTTATDKRIGDDIYMERCSTYDEAEAQHKRIVEMVKKGEIPERE